MKFPSGLESVKGEIWETNNMQTPDNLGMPPRCIESENVVLGNLINSRQTWEEFKGKIIVNAFYDSRNRELVKAMLEMDSKGIPIDPISLLDWFKKAGDPEKAGGWLHWTNLANNAIRGIDIEYHLNQINKAYSRRLLWEKSHRLIQAVEKDDTQLVERLKGRDFRTSR